MNIDLGATLIALLTFFGIAALMAISLNLEYGLAGVPNFGQAVFVSIGAYTAAITYTRILPLLAGREGIWPCGTTLGPALQLRSEIMRTQPMAGFVNFGLTLLLAAVISGLAGYFVSRVALRLQQEWFLALVLLVGGETARIFVRGYEPVICANNGISGVAQPFAWLGNPQLASILFMLLVLVMAALAYLYSERLVRSPFGRLLKAVRENENIARSLGKDVALARARIMLIGSVIAAIAGVMFALNTGYISSNDYVVTLTLDMWVMVVLGGLGNNRGALLGALVVTLLDRITAIATIQMNMSSIELEFNYVRYILYGIILLLMLRYRPQGILPEPARTTHAHHLLAKEVSHVADS